MRPISRRVGGGGPTRSSACVRKVSRKDRRIRKGEWNLAGLQPVHRIRGKTFGFVGYGMIARAVHRKLIGFQLERFLVADPFLTPECFPYEISKKHPSLFLETPANGGHVAFYRGEGCYQDAWHESRVADFISQYSR